LPRHNLDEIVPYWGQKLGTKHVDDNDSQNVSIWRNFSSAMVSM